MPCTGNNLNISIPAELLCGLKMQQIQTNQFFTLQTKGTFQSQRSFGLSYDWCCTSSAALICHQARGCDNWAITAPPFVLSSDPTARRGDSRIYTQMQQQATWENSTPCLTTIYVIVTHKQRLGFWLKRVNGSMNEACQRQNKSKPNYNPS